jgi:hypothetical protein
MNTMQKATGVAALVKVVGDLGFYAVLFAVIPALGLTYQDFADPARAMSAVAAHPSLSYGYASVSVVFAATMLVLSLGLYQRLRATQPAFAQMAAAAGLISSGFYALTAMLDLAGTPDLLALYSRSPDIAISASAATTAVQDSVQFSAFLAFASFLGLNSWAALRARALPRSLAFYGLALGVVGIVLSLLNSVLQPIPIAFPALGLIWSGWLGIALLRGEPVSVGQPMAARTQVSE